VRHRGADGSAGFLAPGRDGPRIRASGRRLFGGGLTTLLIILGTPPAALAQPTAPAASTPGAPAPAEPLRADLVLLDQVVRLRVARGETAAAQADAEFRRRATELGARPAGTARDAALLAEHRREAVAFFAHIEAAYRAVPSWPTNRPAEQYEMDAIGELERARETYAEAIRRGDNPREAFQIGQRVLAWTRGEPEVARDRDAFAGEDERVAAALRASPPSTVATGPPPGPPVAPTPPPAVTPPPGPVVSPPPAVTPPPGPVVSPPPAVTPPPGPVVSPPPAVILPPGPAVPLPPAVILPPGPAVPLPPGPTPPSPPPVLPIPGSRQRGEALFAQWDFRGAAAAFDEAVRAEPSSVEAHIGRGRALNALGDVAGAIGAYQTALRLRPDLPSVHAWLCELYTASSDFARARAALAEELRRVPLSGLARSYEGTLQMLEGRHEEARQTMAVALRLDPAVVMQRHANGDFLGRTAQYRRAMIEFASVLVLDANASGAYFGYGVAAARAGAVPQAVAALEAYLQRDPSSEWAQRAREELSRLRASTGPLVPSR
jgi:tetratricopeptide (TPR) repeat protein